MSFLVQNWEPELQRTDRNGQHNEHDEGERQGSRKDVYKLDAVVAERCLDNEVRDAERRREQANLLPDTEMKPNQTTERPIGSTSGRYNGAVIRMTEAVK